MRHDWKAHSFQTRLFCVAVCGSLLGTLGCTGLSQRESPITHAQRESPITLPHPEFSATRVQALRPGLTVEHVRLLFGPPDQTEVMTFGTATHNPWQGLIYKYKIGSPTGDLLEDATVSLLKSNQIIFSISSEESLVNHFKINTTYPDIQVPMYAQLPAGFTSLLTPQERRKQYHATMEDARRSMSSDNIDQALKHYRRALELAPDDLSRLAALSAIAPVYQQKGDRQNAKIALREAIRISDGLHDAFAAAAGRAILAMILLAEGQRDEAKPLLAQAANSFQTVLSGETTKEEQMVSREGVISALWVLAMIQREDNNNEHAKSTCEKAYAALQEFPQDGELTSNMVTAVTRLGFQYELLKETDRAEACYAMAIRRSESLAGKKEENTYQPYIRLASLYSEQGKFEAADSLYALAVTRCAAGFGWKSKEMVTVLEGYTQMLVEAKRWQDVSKLFGLVSELKRELGIPTETGKSTTTLPTTAPAEEGPMKHQ